MYVFTGAVIFTLIVSIDLFAGGLAYGMQGARLSVKKVFVINIVGKVAIAAALFSGYYLRTVIPEMVGIWLGFSILVTIGIVKIIQSIFSRQSGDTTAQISFRECVVLGLALSLDGVAMAFGTTVASMPFAFIFVVLALMLVTDQVVFMSANQLGLCLLKRGKRRELNLNWLAGAVLIVVAVAKLLLELFTEF